MEGEDRAHDEMNNALQVLFGGVKDDERQKVNDTSDTDGTTHPNHPFNQFPALEFQSLPATCHADINPNPCRKKFGALFETRFEARRF